MKAELHEYIPRGDWRGNFYLELWTLSRWTISAVTIVTMSRSFNSRGTGERIV